jgi:uncharacterized surface protein with fasciclin (FAS1) repeats
MRAILTCFKMLPFLSVLLAFTPHTIVSKRSPRLVSVAQTLAKMRNNSVYFQALIVGKLDLLLDTPSGAPFQYYTVFAPTNAAIEKLRKGRFANLSEKEQERKMQSILAFTIVADNKPVLTLLDGRMLHTLHAFTSLHVVQHNGQTWLTGGTAEPLELRAKPILCDNGTIYVVDEMLVPPARREMPATR